MPYVSYSCNYILPVDFKIQDNMFSIEEMRVKLEYLGVYHLSNFDKYNYQSEIYRDPKARIRDRSDPK